MRASNIIKLIALRCFNRMASTNGDKEKISAAGVDFLRVAPRVDRVGRGVARGGTRRLWGMPQGCFCVSARRIDPK